MSSISKIEAVRVRAAVIQDHVVLEAHTQQYLAKVNAAIGATANELIADAPPNTDVGRFIAAIDALQHAADLFRQAVLVGEETLSRKRRREEAADASEVSQRT